MTRADHLAWAKTRALVYIDKGDPRRAIDSLVTDLNKHPETAVDPIQIYAGFIRLRDPDTVRHWIEGLS